LFIRRWRVSAPTPFTLYARAGDSFTRTLTWTDDAGVPIDLTDASVEWALAGRYSDPIVYQYEDTDEAEITDEAAGVVTLSLTAEQTRELAGRDWRYEVTLTFADETRVTILDGVLVVAPEVVGVLEVPEVEE